MLAFRVGRPKAEHGRKIVKKLDLSDSAPWKNRYRATSIAWAQVADSDPQRGVVCTNRDGIFQLYTWDVPTGDLAQVTDQPAGVISGRISADGEYIIYHRDEGGNEIGHYVRVPFGGGDAEDITPDLPLYSSFFITQSRVGNVTGLTSAERDGYKVYVLADGEDPRMLYRAERISAGPYLSAGGEIAVVETTERSGTLDYSAVAFDVVSGQKIAELWDGEGVSISPGKFSPVVGDFRLFATSSKTGYNRPLVWNPRTGERRDLVVDHIPGELTPWDWSPDGKRLLLNQLHQAGYQLYVYHLGDDSVTRLDHPAGVVGGWFGSFFTADGDIYTTWQDPAAPPRLIALDGVTGVHKRTLLSDGDAPRGHPFRSITYVSENGATIQGWLALPEGQGPFPTILHTHGGPSAVMSEVFFPAAQAWLDHGFAFLSINFHGSTTFGKAFEKSIWGNLGDLEIADMAAAHDWLVEKGIALPDAVLLTGGSYGGYLTLQALGRRPDLWAGGMAAVAIADWRLMYEDQADTLRGYQRALFGGTPDETPEATEASSPITYAEQVQAPLLVIQGRNDTRCPSRQMEAYAAKLKSLGKSIEVHWFDAGHGSRAQEQQIEHQELMMRFAYRVLG
jgi:dipeptidyl aminopeptidase/acylaminoacyl peptidase